MRNTRIAPLAAGHMYLDPAIKAEGFSTASPVTKRRNQFRIQRSLIPRLYKKIVNVGSWAILFLDELVVQKFEMGRFGLLTQNWLP